MKLKLVCLKIILMKMNKPDGCFLVKASIKDGSFFKKWLIFSKPFHMLTDREIDVASLFLKKRYELSKAISDQDIVDRMVMDTNTRKQILEECGLKAPHLQIILSKMKKCGMLTQDNRINHRFIPNIKNDSKSFNLLLYFDLNDSK